MNRGFTIFEVLISIAIIVIIGSISVSVFSRLSNSTSLDKDAHIVLSYIEKARAMAINSVDAVEHGVKFDTNSVKIFSGTAYNVSNIETDYNLPGSATISAINLSPAGSEVFFEKLTGNASATGTITVLSSKNGSTKVINIYGTGLAEIQ